jgi:hypothetical protein
MESLGAIAWPGNSQDLCAEGRAKINIAARWLRDIRQ